MSDNPNHFQLFNLTVTFDIDSLTLAQHYRELQRMIHPDNYINAGSGERLLALQKTAQINDAYHTLKDPIQRGRYLLNLQGYSPSTEFHKDPVFLMEQIELREELMQIQQLTALNEFLTRLEQRMRQLIQQLSHQLAAQQFPTADITLQQLQFFKRLQEEALTLEETLT